MRYAAAAINAFSPCLSDSLGALADARCLQRGLSPAKMHTLDPRGRDAGRTVNSVFLRLSSSMSTELSFFFLFPLTGNRFFVTMEES